MIPRAIWISTAMLLLGMSARPAMADPTVIVNSSNDATEIDNLVIGTSTYDVTFGANPTPHLTPKLSQTGCRCNRYCLERCPSAPYPWTVEGKSTFVVCYSYLGSGTCNDALSYNPAFEVDGAQGWYLADDEGNYDTNAAQFTEVPSTVPEPATVTTLLGGAIFLLVLKRRRKPLAFRRVLPF